MHFTAVTRVTENGVIGEDGIERKCDTIICATGFDTTYRPRFPIVGRGGVDLRDKWAVCPEGYMGLAVPEMPNFIQFIGPSWPVENGSVMGPLMHVSLYALKVIRKLQTEYISSLCPRQDVTDAFNAHVQEWIRHTVWSEDCRSWYRNNETGRVNAVWPGSSLHYIKTIETPRWEDFEIRRLGPALQNPFAFLGMGFSKDDVEGADYSPYISLDNLEPQWMKAVGIKPPPDNQIVGDGSEDPLAEQQEERAWSTGATWGAACLAGAASVLLYSLRNLPRRR